MIFRWRGLTCQLGGRWQAAPGWRWIQHRRWRPLYVCAAETSQIQRRSHRPHETTADLLASDAIRIRDCAAHIDQSRARRSTGHAEERPLL